MERCTSRRHRLRGKVCSGRPEDRPLKWATLPSSGQALKVAATRVAEDFGFGRSRRRCVDIVKGNMGWIEVVVGPMFSGKSEELIRRLRRAEIARQRVQIFKPSIDSRYAANEIVSHNGLGIPSDNVTKASEIIEKMQPRTEVVGID